MPANLDGFPAEVRTPLEQAVANLRAPSRLNNSPCVAIGSITKGDLFRIRESDIDLCVFVQPAFFTDNARQLISSVNETKHLWSSALVEPHFLADFHNQRVEAVFALDGFNFDITWLDGSIKVGSTTKEITRDQLELYIGEIYVYSVSLTPEPTPESSYVEKHLLPFYADELRDERLKAVSYEMERMKLGIDYNVRRNDWFSALNWFLRWQKTFLQYLFIYTRRYPWSYEKWLPEQFSTVLKLPHLFEQFQASFTQSINFAELTAKILDIEQYAAQVLPHDE